MKIYLYILAFTAFSFSAFGQTQAPLMMGYVNWYTIQEAQKLNKTNPRKIMVDVYTDWCGWCKKMDKETFTNPIIASYLNTKFYAVKFNAEGSDSIEFAGKWYASGGGPRATHQLALALLKGQASYPSVAYITESLEYIGVDAGYKTPEQLEMVLAYISQDKYKTVSFEDFSKTFVGQLKAK